MDVRAGLQAIRRRWWLAVLVPMAAVALALALAARQPDVYGATTSVLFTRGAPSTPGSSGDLADEPGRFLQTQAEVLSSAPVRQAAAEAAGGTIDYTVDPVFDADVLDVNATASTPVAAASGANAAARAYLDLRAARVQAELDAATLQLNAQIAALDAQIAALDAQAGGATGAMGIARLEQQRGALVDARTQLRVALARGDQPTAAAGLAAEIATLDAELAIVDQQIAAATAAGPPAAAIEQQRASVVTARTDLQQRLNEYRVGAALSADSVRVLAPAEPQEEPISPRPLRSAAFALGAGLLGGLALAFLWGRRPSSRVQRVEEPRPGLLGVPDLPVQPAGSALQMAEDLRHGLPGVPVLAEFARPAAANQMRSGPVAATQGAERLRAALTDPRTSRPPHRIQLTSASGETDTSVVAADLAASFADAGLRTLVVDCNLRQPGLAGALGLDPLGGVSEILRGDTSLTGAVLGASGRTLGALTAGRPDPRAAELIGGERFEQLMSNLASGCDVLVVDTPGVRDFVDAALVAALVDSTLVVASPGRSRVSEVREALGRLQRADAKVGGLVLVEGTGGADEARRGTTGAHHSPDPEPTDQNVSEVDESMPSGSRYNPARPNGTPASRPMPSV